jgi:hypothetical protein
MESASNGMSEVWRERVTAQLASGQSIRAWCRQQNHHEHAFYWWRSRLGLSPKLAAKPAQRHQPKRIKFAEVVVDHPVGDPMRLRLNGGRELILPVSMPAQQLAALIRALETPL